MSYETGDSVYVLVADADRNVSTSASDTLTVRLRSDKETTEEALVLTETGVNTGIFSAYMLFDETGSVSADGKLQVDRGDKLVATLPRSFGRLWQCEPTRRLHLSTV